MKCNFWKCLSFTRKCFRQIKSCGITENLVKKIVLGTKQIVPNKEANILSKRKSKHREYFKEPGNIPILKKYFQKNYSYKNDKMFWIPKNFFQTKGNIQRKENTENGNFTTIAIEIYGI